MKIQSGNQRRAEADRSVATSLVRADARHFPPLDEIFDRDNPVEVEIGCGKGRFLIARASEHPEIDFLGIDVVWKWMKYAVERSDKRGLENIRFAKADAWELLEHAFEPGRVSVFHVYFPDPWPKRRHRKRRLVTGRFLRLLYSRLQPGGLVELATDFEDYFLQMRRAVVQSGMEWRGVLDRSNERLFEALAKTNYELKYETAGRTLYYLELRK